MGNKPNKYESWLDRKRAGKPGLNAKGGDSQFVLPRHTKFEGIFIFLCG